MEVGAAARSMASTSRVSSPRQVRLAGVVRSMRGSNTSGAAGSRPSFLRTASCTVARSRRSSSCRLAPSHAIDTRSPGSSTEATSGVETKLREPTVIAAWPSSGTWMR
ncbi:Uncharacterised protein [Mycobacteroides abscessus subsp. abscessus]|nr:Uncharacterised protein [Mycobacteroides abscessus subsp. abscessus]